MTLHPIPSEFPTNNGEYFISSYFQAPGRPWSGCPLMRLSMVDAIVLAGRGCPARFSVARLSMDAVVRRRGFPWRGCQWMRLSAGVVFRGAVVRRLGIPRTLFSAGVVFRFPFPFPFTP